MSAGRYVLGWVELAAALGCLAWAAVRVRRRIAPGIADPAARLADVVIAVALLVLICEALGTIGLFRAWAVFPTCVILGVGVGRGVRPAAGVRKPDAGKPASTRALAGLVVVSAVLVFGYSILTLAAFRNGFESWDTLWYHLPVAAGFVQQHSLTALHVVATDDLHQFFPANGELLHAVGMLAFGRDIVSVVINLGFAALALLGGWCLGRPRNAELIGALAVAAILAAPQMLEVGGGTAMMDVPTLGFALAAVALLLHARADRGLFLIAATAAGLAVGTKATALVFALILGAGACLAVKTARRREWAVTWVAGLALGGGYWYLRNAVAIGNPLPGSLPFLPTPHYLDGGGTLARAAVHGKVGGDYLVHSLNFALGPGWWALCLLAALGLVSGLAPSRAWWERASAAAGLANLVAFPFSPYSFFFLQFNIRFLAVSGALGLCLLLTAPWMLSRRVVRMIAYAGVAALLGIGVARYEAHAVPHGHGPAVIGLTALVVGSVGVAMWQRRVSPRIAMLVLAGVLVAGSGFPLSRSYVGHRFKTAALTLPGGVPAGPSLTRTFSWAQGVRQSRIGLFGTPLQLPLYGRDLSNVVRLIGVPTSVHGFREARSCREWRHALSAGRFRVVVLTAPNAPVAAPVLPPQAAWMQGDPAIKPVLAAGGGAAVFRIAGPVGYRGCTNRRTLSRGTVSLQARRGKPGG